MSDFSEPCYYSSESAHLVCSLVFSFIEIEKITIESKKGSSKSLSVLRITIEHESGIEEPLPLQVEGQTAVMSSRTYVILTFIHS